LAARGCTVMVDGAQILTEEISAIPDVVVTCSPIDHSTPVIALPVIIVEVISPSSELNDTGLRWLAYRNVPSLKHYLVLSQDQRLVHVHSRAGDIWRERFLSAGVLELDEPPVGLEIDALYAATDLAA
jgi:Uma2 family endonuclease